MSLFVSISSVYTYVCMWCHVEKNTMKQSEYAHRSLETRLYVSCNLTLECAESIRFILWGRSDTNDTWN